MKDKDYKEYRQTQLGHIPQDSIIGSNGRLGSILSTKLSETNKSVINIVRGKSKLEKGQRGLIRDIFKLSEQDISKEVIVEPKINLAFTNINGVAEYGESDKELDKTLLYNLKDVITVEESVTIPGQSSITVPLKVNMPDEAYKGILAGGITFKEKKSEEENKTTKEDNNLSIKNEYAYVVGVVLRESDEAVKPELKLNQVLADQVNARNAVKVNLQNTTPTFVDKLKVTTAISKKGSKDVLYRATKESMQMAPNSNFDFPTMLEGEKLAAGTYLLSMDATSDDNTWHFEQEFTIDADEAKTLNKSDVTIHEDYTWIYILLSALGGMLLMFALYLIFRKKK